MSNQPETITPPMPAAPVTVVPESRYLRMIKLLREMIGNQALQIVELRTLLEERTAALVGVAGELEEMKKQKPGGTDGNENRPR